MKSDATTEAARAIVAAERAQQDAKTARLRAAREAKEAAELPSHAGKAKGKPRA